MTPTLRCAGLSDPGRKRRNNEDRYHFDAENGILFVVDGVGGQAAGETAADTACRILRGRLERQTGSVPDRIREAITLANNEIYRLAQTNDEWHGMACVLTVGVVDEDSLVIGHVGDSRLYLLEPGSIRKLTHDHSPVGEREDRGEIDEWAAMRHPRRNEVYRDVGTSEHTPDDPDFIELSVVPFSPEGALLLCSDGLSDLITSKHIQTLVEQHAGDPQAAVQSLVDAANEAGGKDNVTVVLAEGPRFAPGVRRWQSSPRVVTPLDPVRKRPFAAGPAVLLYGILIGVLAIAATRPYLRETPQGLRLAWGTVREQRTWRVTTDIASALAQAQPGDTVLVAPGTYNEQIRLRDGVRLISEKPRQAVIRTSGVAVLGEDLRSGYLEGFRIQPDDSVYLQVGIQLFNSNVEVTDNEVTGTVTAGIEVQGSRECVLRSNIVRASSRVALLIGGEGEGPRVTGNDLAAEGHPAVVIHGGARPVLTSNVIRGSEPLLVSPDSNAGELLRLNTVIPSQPPKERLPAGRNAPARVR